MTEKRLRELGTFTAEGGVERCAFCHVPVSAGEHYPHCPMADDPDVVGVLRRATQGSLEAINDFEKFMYDCEIRWIQDTFYVRLTDEPPGYEYTE